MFDLFLLAFNFTNRIESKIVMRIGPFDFLLTLSKYLNMCFVLHNSLAMLVFFH